MVVTPLIQLNSPFTIPLNTYRPFGTSEKFDATKHSPPKDELLETELLETELLDDELLLLLDDELLDEDRNQHVAELELGLELTELAELLLLELLLTLLLLPELLLLIDLELEDEDLDEELELETSELLELIEELCDELWLEYDRFAMNNSATPEIFHLLKDWFTKTT